MDMISAFVSMSSVVVFCRAIGTAEVGGGGGKASDSDRGRVKASFGDYQF
jgi:hypothetical protein